MKRLVIAVAFVGLMGVAFTPSARADAWNKKTMLTVNEMIQVPNKVLPPGQYVMKLMDSSSDRHIVQIFNANETHLEATVLAIPDYRVEPTGKTVFTFWETPPGQPKALKEWFYPGDNFGQEFAYPKSALMAFASATHAAPAVEEPKPAETAAAPVTTEPQREEAAAAAPEPAPTPVAEPAPAPEPTPQASEAAPEQAPVPAELPKTGSPYPLIGLAGVFSLGLFALVRAIRSA